MAKTTLTLDSLLPNEKKYDLQAGECCILGRDSDCTIVIETDPMVSRYHCVFEDHGEFITVRDLGSRNGTYVNGKRLAKGVHPNRGDNEGDNVGTSAACALSSGHVVQIGGTFINVTIEREYRCRKCSARLAIERSDNATLSNICAACSAEEEANVVATVAFVPPCTRCGAQVTDHELISDCAEFKCSNCRRLDQPSLPASHLVKTVAFQPANAVTTLTVPNYTLLCRIGRGAMGVVYKARSELTKKNVAIKVMLSQANSHDADRFMFQREIEILRQLDHPHIVRLLDYGFVEGGCYFVMTLSEGGNVHSWLDKLGGKFPAKPAMFMFLQTLKGLEYAHGRGVVHRDIKPLNLFLRRVGKGWQVQIGDFGLSKSCELAGYSRFTATGQIGGTLEFMPREQLTNYRRLEPASDLWSTAASFYYLLTGKTPRDFNKSMDPLQVILNQDAVPIRQRIANFPTHFAVIFDRALSDRMDARYKTASELMADLRHALKG